MSNTLKIHNRSQNNFQFSDGQGGHHILIGGQTALVNADIGKKLLADYPQQLVGEETAVQDFTARAPTADFSSPKDVGFGGTSDAQAHNDAINSVAKLYKADAYDEKDGVIHLLKKDKEIAKGTLEELKAHAPKH